jgi:1,4-dihydroxy-2-naphthoyl-CoA hydrolase
MSAEFTTLRTPQHFNSAGAGKLPGHLGIVITEVSASRVSGELPVVESVMAPNGYLHAGTIVTLADTVCGYGCIANLPADASGFTTIELKSNHLGTTLDGTIVAVATPLHRGKTTQVWDAIVTHKESGRTLAAFRCTQMILYAKQKPAAAP